MPISARAIWKGQLRLSLVAIPIELYSATDRSARVSLRQFHEPSGKPIRYEKTVPGIGPVDADEIIKGYEVEDDFIPVTTDELDDIKLESRKTIELVQFVGACEIDPLYFDKPYYVVPQDELSEDAFRVLRDALKESEKIGIGQMTMRGREYLVAIKNCGTGLLLETLHYEEEIRKTDSFFSELDASSSEEDLLKVARDLISAKTAPFDAGAFKDRYTVELRKLIDRKSKGKKPIAQGASGKGERGGDNVIDLMSALKKSLAENGGKKRATKSAAKTPAKPTAKSTAKKSGTTARGGSSKSGSGTRRKAS